MQGVRREPSSSVKYLGVYLDDNLSWDIHIREPSKCIMSKLHHYIPKTTMLQIYYALFYSHMSYGSLVWSITTQKNLKIVKFPDIITKNQLLFVHQLINNILPHD